MFKAIHWVSRVGLGLVLAWPVQAQIEVDSQLAGLFERALANSPALQLSAAQQSAAQQRLLGAKAVTEPQLSLQSELSYAWMQNKEFARTANQIKASYPLYQPDNTSRIEVAESQVSAAQWQLEAERQQLLLKVALGYYRYWEAFAQQVYFRDEQDAISDMLRQIEQRFQLGYQDLNDIAEVQARLDRNRADQLLSQQRLRVIESDLQALLGHPIEMAAMQPPTVLPPVTIEVSPPLAEAGDFHPALSQLSEKLEAIQQQVALVKDEDGLQVELFGAYAYNESDGNFYDDMNGFKGGVQLNLPLYLGNRTDAKVGEVRALSQQVRAQQRALKLELAAQSQSQWWILQTGVKRLALLETVLQSSQQALQATESGLGSGSRNILDVLNAQRRLHKAERDIPVLRAQVWQAWYQWLWAQGKLTF